jgi:hypothetical protein
MLKTKDCRAKAGQSIDRVTIQLLLRLKREARFSLECSILAKVGQ